MEVNEQNKAKSKDFDSYTYLTIPFGSKYQKLVHYCQKYGSSIAQLCIYKYQKSYEKTNDSHHTIGIISKL
jgi:hypothetical protein